MTSRCHSKTIVKGKKSILSPFLLKVCISGFSREPRQPRMSQKAVNRWFLAVTLLRNPSFIKYRRQGRHFTASVVTLGSVNFDIPV